MSSVHISTRVFDLFRPAPELTPVSDSAFQEAFRQALGMALGRPDVRVRLQDWTDAARSDGRPSDTFAKALNGRYGFRLLTSLGNRPYLQLQTDLGVWKPLPLHTHLMVPAAEKAVIATLRALAAYAIGFADGVHRDWVPLIMPLCRLAHRAVPVWMEPDGTWVALSPPSR